MLFVLALLNQSKSPQKYGIYVHVFAERNRILFPLVVGSLLNSK